jgi:hypothetical protein
MVAFVQFRPQTQNMNFSRSREKNSQKKCASILSKVCPKESLGNTEKKVGLRQTDISKF